MALWDTADLLARCKRQAKRPSTDMAVVDGDWYAWLTEAQVKWVTQIATHVPHAMYGDPVKLTTSDSGLTYQFPGGAVPLGQIEVRESPTGRILIPCAEWETGGDFVPEGDQIRFPSGAMKTFSDGPYARYVNEPGEIALASEPVLKPDYGRMLLVHQACIYYAESGGNRDPTPWYTQLKHFWLGDANDPSDVGLLGALKLQYRYAGARAAANPNVRWYHMIDSGEGYVMER